MNLGPAFRQSTFVLIEGSTVVYRPNSTFDWPSPFALFLALAIFLNVSLLISGRGWARVVWFVSLALIVGTFLLENQRYLFLLVPPLVGLMLLLRRRMKVPWLVVATVALVATGIVGLQWLPDNPALVRITGLLQNQDEVFAVRLETYWEHFLTALKASPIGLGTGATSLGSRYAATDIPLFIEFSLAKVVGDLSTVGLFVYMWMFATLIFETFKSMRAAEARAWPRTADMALAVLAWQLLVLYAGYDLAAAALPLWFLSGCCAFVLWPSQVGSSTRMRGRAVARPSSTGLGSSPRTERGASQPGLSTGTWG